MLFVFKALVYIDTYTSTPFPASFSGYNFMIVFEVDAWYVRVPDLAEAYAVNWILSDYLSELGKY